MKAREILNRRNLPPYLIAEAPHWRLLNKIVCDMMNDYRPIGGVFNKEAVIGESIWCQAMVRRPFLSRFIRGILHPHTNTT